MPFVCVAEYLDSTRRILGNPNHACTMQTKASVGTLLVNNYAITIKCQAPEPAMYVTEEGGIQ